MKKMDQKAFTLIEVVVVVAIIGILVLLGSPRLLGYTEKAQLTRIQHDVKVMEQEMGEVLSTNNQEFGSFQNNGKDLGRVILRKELFEKEGVAKNVNWEHLSINSYANSNSDNEDNELGTGGDLIEIEVDDKYSTYKIIPKEYSRKVNTKLKGTFYVNSLGKVYYEHNKPLGEAIEKESLACVAPESLGYEFEIVNELGTITGWNGNATHLVIPASFKMSDGEEEWCEPVRVIGKGAFQNGTFKKVTIPQSVETIEDEAFQGGQLIEIEVPHSVTTVGNNAFSGNPATSSGGSGGSRVIIKGSSDGRNISDSAFGGLTPNYSPVTDKDLGVITKTKNSGNSGGKTVSIVGKTVTSDSSSGGSRDYSNTVINIPNELEVNGETLPVTEIEKGAFQGSGLIDVIMPEGLLYIHDYAFAGNQLIRAIIPNSVTSVGNYAFAYNEIESKPTIDPINILKDKFTGNFGDVNNDGNISEPVSTIDLKDHIFITSSMGNHVIEDVGANPEQSEGNNDNDNDEIVIPGPQPDTNGSVDTSITTDGTYTFHGEVSTANLISGNELAKQISLTAGTPQYNDSPWLKFTRKAKDGKITTMFVAKKPYRYNLSWDQINARGAVFGGKTVEIDGQTYKVRLMKGALTNPSENNNPDRGAHGSEWNRMMLPIHEQALNKGWAHPAYVEQDIGLFTHSLGTGKNGMYTDADLLTHKSHGNGSYSWTQETVKSNSSYRVIRGYNGVSFSYWTASADVGSALGWRPVLELVPAS